MTRDELERLEAVLAADTARWQPFLAAAGDEDERVYELISDDGRSTPG